MPEASRDRSLGTFAKNNMKPSQLTQIIIRLFAISWFLQGIIQTAGIFAMNGRGMPQPMLLFGGGVAILLAFGAWFLAPQIGRWIAHGNDQEGAGFVITFQQLLNAMFIGVGSYYGLASIGGLINSLHFFFVLQAAPESVPEGMHLSPYEFSKSAITFAAGVFLIIFAPHWSRRIANR